MASLGGEVGGGEGGGGGSAMFPKPKTYKKNQILAIIFGTVT